MLGHSSIAITLDTYSHVLSTMQESAIRALQRIAMTLTRWHASSRGYALIHDSGALPVDNYQFCSW